MSRFYHQFVIFSVLVLTAPVAQTHWMDRISQFACNVVIGEKNIQQEGIGFLQRPNPRSEEQLSYQAPYDLTVDELNSIQSIVNDFKTPLIVFGSSVYGKRRNRGTNLPLGKGEGTKSDIDIAYHEQWVDLLIEARPDLEKFIIDRLRYKVSVETMRRLPEVGRGVKLGLSGRFLYRGPKLLFSPDQDPIHFMGLEFIFMSDYLETPVDEWFVRNLNDEETWP